MAAFLVGLVQLLHHVRGHDLAGMAAHALAHGEGHSFGWTFRRPGGHEEGLRRTRGDAAGA